MPALANALSAGTRYCLKNTAASGIYTKVTSNTQGIITDGTQLAAGDLPPISFAKVSLDRPTTVDGYGITDGVKQSGGVITGNVTLAADPVANDDAVTKQYADACIASGGGGGGSTGVATGDIFCHGSVVPPVECLKADGGTYDTATYPALYALVKDQHGKGTVAGAGRPWEQQCELNTTGDAIGAWGAGTGLPVGTQHASVVVTKNRVYLLGGLTPVAVDTVYTAAINPDGTLGTWTEGTPLPAACYGAACVVAENRVYLIGGSITTVISAPINSDGTLGVWREEVALTAVTNYATAVVLKGAVYLFGGMVSGSPTNRIYRATFGVDGVLSSWKQVGILPISVYGTKAIVTRSRVYLIGGYNGSNYLATTLYASVSSDGRIGAWASGTSMPGVLHGSMSVVTKNRIYMISGYNGSAYVATVYTAPIDGDGAIGTWTTDTALYSVQAYGSAIVVNNRLYTVGGRNGTGTVASVNTATFSGGSNDYSAYYQATLDALGVPLKFSVPNMAELTGKPGNWCNKY